MIPKRHWNRSSWMNRAADSASGAGNARGELETAYSQSETAQQDLEALKAEYENDRDAKIAEDQQVEAEIQQIYAQLAAQQQAAEEAQQANNNDGSSSLDGSDSSSSSTVTVDTGEPQFPLAASGIFDHYLGIWFQMGQQPYRH